jgi:hypothetical protein
MAASIAHLPEKPSDRDHNKQQVAVVVAGASLRTGRLLSPSCAPSPSYFGLV